MHQVTAGVVKMKSLPDRVSLRPEVLRRLFVHHSHQRRAFLVRFKETAPFENGNAQRREVAVADVGVERGQSFLPARQRAAFGNNVEAFAANHRYHGGESGRTDAWSRAARSSRFL